MGALFAQMLFERKFRGLRPLDKKPLDESIGSLLTRIFKHHDIDLSDTPCVDTIDRFDAQFFLNTKILHSAAITSLTSVENMEFMPPAEVLYTPPPPASKHRRGSSSSGPAQTQSPPLDGTQQQQFAWIVDTLVKLSTMMQTVWGALAKIRCPPTPSCCRAPQTSEAAGMTGDDAGDEPSDEAADAERGSRLHRSRRAPGQRSTGWIDRLVYKLIDPDGSDITQQQFAWTADTLVKLSTMMQTVWGALAKIRCPPTPSCCRAPQISEAAGMAGDTPDVVGPLDEDDAGDEPSDEAADAERGSRLHRSRRAP
ncbi:hypothetical protein F2Q68_00026059 [Brassica cretica]|uniref:Uncharacterized protein n=1 Tax=Brassica cretica TaxID=69181 RepID=A0A8S9IF43_BRACR|nr:hypothetical protein F2Q68_00026059 [Brassica cretica]